MTDEEIAHHIDLVRNLSRPGGALAPGAPGTTMNNPEWWRDGEPTPERRRLHRDLRQQVRAAHPHVEQNWEAVVLAGPPGAGKSSVIENVLGDDLDKYLPIDADDFKHMLMQTALDDGTFETWIKPTEIRDLETGGERFFPLELASLVHEESSYISKQLRSGAIANGDNLVIDTVLSNQQGAIELGNTLAAAGYRVHVIDVEVPYEISEQRIRSRWERAYRDALNGQNLMGGRWVPSEYARDVFNGPDYQSRPRAAAEALATSCPAVLTYRVILNDRESPRTVIDRSRAGTGKRLLDTKIAAAARRASAARPPKPRPGPELGE